MGGVELSTVVVYAFAIVFGAVSLAQVVEWGKADSRVVRTFKPAEGVYAAPAASAAAGQWAVFSAFCGFLTMPLSDFGAGALVVFSALFVAFVCLILGTVVWLFMPDGFLVPKALPGCVGLSGSSRRHVNFLCPARTSACECAC